MDSICQQVHLIKMLPQLSITLIWLPIIEGLLRKKIKPSTRLYVILDRTQWKTNNVLGAKVLRQTRETKLVFVNQPELRRGARCLQN